MGENNVQAPPMSPVPLQAVLALAAPLQVVPAPATPSLPSVFFDTRQTSSLPSVFLPSVFSAALGKELIRRVPEGIHSTNIKRLGKFEDSGSETRL